MDDIQKDKLNFFPVSELQRRYEITRWSVYERLKVLKIKGERYGQKLYLTLEQLRLLDEHNAHLKAGGSTAQFIQKQTACQKIVLSSEQKSIESVESVLVVGNMEPDQEITCFEQSLSQIFEEKFTELTAEELQEIDQEAQQRALARIIARDTLTLLYEVNQSFSTPDIIEQLAEHKKKYKQALEIKSAQYESTNFLSHSRLFQTWKAGKGG